jgi:tRNA (guanine-N7-)-methyltransferase
MDNASRTAQYLALLEQRRADLRAEFARSIPAEARFVWEIGCGHGHFLNAYASQHPDQLCVGIDITADRIERAKRKRDRARLTNLHFIHTDAWTFVQMLPSGAIFSDIYVLFPDPWPKLRHRKHRILQPDFLSAVAGRAGEATHLYFRTDFQPYFDDVSGMLRSSPDWALTEEPWPFEHGTVFQERAKQYSSLVARPCASSAN